MGLAAEPPVLILLGMVRHVHIFFQLHFLLFLMSGICLEANLAQELQKLSLPLGT